MFKKVNSLVVVAISFGCFMGGMMLERYTNKPAVKSDSTLIECYRGYVVSTEHLLDLIDAKWSWVDAFDHDGYYESRAEVFHLDSVGIQREKERQEKCFQMNTQMFNN